MHYASNTARRLIKLAQEAAAASPEQLLPLLAQRFERFATVAHTPLSDEQKALHAELGLEPSDPATKALGELERYLPQYLDRRDEIFQQLLQRAGEQGPLRRAGDDLILQVETRTRRGPRTIGVPITPNAAAEWLALLHAAADGAVNPAALPQDPVARLALAVRAQHAGLYAARQRALSQDKLAAKPQTAAADYNWRMGLFMPLSTSIRLSLVGPQLMPVFARRAPTVLASDRLASHLAPALRRFAQSRDMRVLREAIGPDSFLFPTDPDAAQAILNEVLSSRDAADAAVHLANQLEAPDRRERWEAALDELYKAAPRVAADVDLLGKARVANGIDTFLFTPRSPGARFYEPWLALNEGESVSRAGRRITYDYTPPNWRLRKDLPRSNADLAIQTNSTLAPAIEFWQRNFRLRGTPGLESQDLLGLFRMFHRTTESRHRQREHEAIEETIPLDRYWLVDPRTFNNVIARMALTRTDPGSGHEVWTPERYHYDWAGRRLREGSPFQIAGEIGRGVGAVAETITTTHPTAVVRYGLPNLAATGLSGSESGRQAPLLGMLAFPSWMTGYRLAPVGSPLDDRPKGSVWENRGLWDARLQAAGNWLRNYGRDRKGVTGFVQNAVSDAMAQLAADNAGRTGLIMAPLKNVPGVRYIASPLEHFSRSGMQVGLATSRGALRALPWDKRRTVGQALDDYEHSWRRWGRRNGPWALALSEGVGTGLQFLQDAPFFLGTGALQGGWQGASRASDRLRRSFFARPPRGSLDRVLRGIGVAGAEVSKGVGAGVGEEAGNLGIFALSQGLAPLPTRIADYLQGAKGDYITNEDIAGARQRLQQLEAILGYPGWDPMLSSHKSQLDRERRLLRNFVESYEGRNNESH